MRALCFSLAVLVCSLGLTAHAADSTPTAADPTAATTTSSKKAKAPRPPVTLAPQSETAPAAGHAACGTAPAGMSCVPGGPAIVGDDSERGSPKRIVELSTFYIDQKEITHGQYQACVDAKVCKPLPPSTSSTAAFRGADQPAAPLSWPQAQRFCTWAGKRLPTEWEWEKAARGPNGDLWPWGNDAPSCDKAHTRECVPSSCKSPDCKEHTTKKAGALPAGHYGLFDMAGNGYEWTATWFAPDTETCGPRCNDKDPMGPCDGANPCPRESQKVLRGGSWYWPAKNAAPFARRGEVQETPQRVGARCASSTPTLATSPPKLLTEQRPAPPAPTAPTAEQLNAFAAITEDELAKQVCEQKGRSFVDCRDPNHYIRSNEPRQFIWRPYIENLGGGYAGVGIDQNYSFIAHAKSEWVWLFDYDPTVVRLHFVLRAVILDAPDRKTFLSHFAPDAKERVLELLSKTYAETPERAAYREIYAVARSSLYKYYENQTLGNISIPDIVKAPTSSEDKPKRKAGVKVGEESADPTFGWLATEEAYQYIRLLYQQGRVHIMKGDMLAKNTMQGIGAAAKAIGVPIRIYYPSNAPECWPWTEQYKKNVLALPFDERSVVLQTLSGIKTGYGRQIGYWHHNVQSGLQQQELARKRGVGSLKQAVFDRLPGNDPDVSTCGLAGG
jgi:formylglycine-generating enzyme required for sulfatase activity